MDIAPPALSTRSWVRETESASGDSPPLGEEPMLELMNLNTKVCKERDCEQLKVVLLKVYYYFGII